MTAAAEVASSKNPFDTEDDPYSPVTDPSNPFYDEIPSNMNEKEKTPPPPPALPPSPPSKTRLYPNLPEYEEIKPSTNSPAAASESVYCVDRRFRTEAPTTSLELAVSSTRSSTSSVEVEMLPSVAYDNDRNNNNSTSNNNFEGENITDCNAVSNDTYWPVIPRLDLAAADAGDIEIFIDAPSSPSSPNVTKKPTTTSSARVEGCNENVDIASSKDCKGSYDDVPPSYAVVQKIRKPESSPPSMAVSTIVSDTPASPLPAENASSADASEADPEVLRRNRPVATPRRRPLSASRPPLPPIPTHAVSDMAINRNDDDDDELIKGSNLSLDEALYETVLPRSEGRNAVYSTAASSTLSPQAPSRSRKSIRGLNVASGGDAAATAEASVADNGTASNVARETTSKEVWVPISQR